MDPEGICTKRLFRDQCTYIDGGTYVKDMSKIGRDLKDAVILDNTPKCYSLQPECGVPITSWYDDPDDK